jgi:hypothetical protein
MRPKSVGQAFPPDALHILPHGLKRLTRGRQEPPINNPKFNMAKKKPAPAKPTKKPTPTKRPAKAISATAPSAAPSAAAPQNGKPAESKSSAPPRMLPTREELKTLYDRYTGGAKFDDHDKAFYFVLDVGGISRAKQLVAHVEEVLAELEELH